MLSIKLKDGNLPRQYLHEILCTCHPSELDYLITDLDLIPQRVEYRHHDKAKLHKALQLL